MAEEYYRTNPAFKKPYDYFKCITIVNPKQAAFYVSKGVHLLDVRLGRDRESEEPILLYYFLREETKSVFDEWCNRKTDQK